MKTLLATILLFAASSAYSVEHLDVIKVKIKPECSVAEYVAITEDFNESWGKAHGYHAWVAVPIQSEDLYTVWWMGTSANAATYGAAWDTWRDAQSDPESVEAKLWARFLACSDNAGRWGYDLY